MTDANQTPTFDEWAVIELLGHRRVAGRVREVQIAGAGFLRIDIPPTQGHAAQTQYVSPGSVYALHPVTEQVATASAANCRPEPIARWELPASEPGPVLVYDDEPF
jgi:hypothetical protein